MAVTSRTDLKEYFQQGNKPTQTQFIDLIDSFVHIGEGDNDTQITDTLHISGSETYTDEYNGVSQTYQLGLSVSGSILPGEDGVFDLGSPTNYWRKLYVSDQSIEFVSGSSGTELGRISINSSSNAIEFAKAGGPPSVQIDQTGTQGFLAVMGDTGGAASTILRAENIGANGAEYGMAGLEVKGSGSFKLMLGADHSSVSNYPNQKFVIEANAAFPGAGKRLLTVSESGETKTNYLVANGLATPTTISTDTNIPPDHTMTLSTTRYQPTITVNEFINLTVGEGADLTIKNVFA
tara:strand:- start:179 stop:1057 length:879 start_codon:yes stop_codon:yes gene_type:complete